MKVIGIIGAIASGKSTIRELLANQIEGLCNLNVRQFDIDVVIKELYTNNQSFRDELLINFGPTMLLKSSNKLRTDYVIDTIFNDDDMYSTLMKILEHYISVYIEKIKYECIDSDIDVLIIE